MILAKMIYHFKGDENMKAMLVAIQPKWLKMILDGKKKYEFRNWKLPVGTVIYFYCTKAKPHLRYIVMDGSETLVSKSETKGFYTLIRDELNGKIVAKAVVKDVLDLDKLTYEPNYVPMGSASVDSGGTLFYEGEDFGYAPKHIWSDIGYTNQRYALELDQVQAIEPKDVTDFVGWNKLKRHKHVSETMEDGFKRLPHLKLTKPPQSRTWVYVEE